MDPNSSHDIYRLPMPAAPGAPISEFNHHIAGLVVFIVGLSALLLYVRPRTFSALRYVWPVGLLLLGVYLILYGDPEGWPAVANVSLMDRLSSDPSVRQHFVFAVLLVVMGMVELGRAIRIFRGAAWRWAFPALAAFGALFLLAHEHVGPEHAHHNHGPAGQTESALVRFQHMLYLGLGLGIAASKLLNDLRIVRNNWIPYVWPSLAMALGIALMLYAE